jgi:hypothetical protein
MTKFAGVMLSLAALTLCMTSIAFGQNAEINARGQSVTVTTPTFSTPERAQSIAADPETITIYSNIGSGYNCCDGYTEGGASSPVGLVYQAMAFTPKATHYLAQIDYAMGYVVGTNGLTMHVESDAAGVPSGKILWSCKRANLPTFGSTGTQLKTCKVAATKKVKLLKGKQYWLVPIPNSDEWAAWNLNGTNASGQGASTTDGTTWTAGDYNPNGAFDVLGR